MRPVRRLPMLVFTDLLTSWKTSEKLKLRSRLSDTSILFGDVSIREFFPSTLTACSWLVLGSALYKDWILHDPIGGLVPWIILETSGVASSAPSRTRCRSTSPP